MLFTLLLHAMKKADNSIVELQHLQRQAKELCQTGNIEDFPQKQQKLFTAAAQLAACAEEGKAPMDITTAVDKEICKASKQCSTRRSRRSKAMTAIIGTFVAGLLTTFGSAAYYVAQDRHYEHLKSTLNTNCNFQPVCPNGNYPPRANVYNQPTNIWSSQTSLVKPQEELEYFTDITDANGNVIKKASCIMKNQGRRGDGPGVVDNCISDTEEKDNAAFYRDLSIGGIAGGLAVAFFGSLCCVGCCEANLEDE